MKLGRVYHEAKTLSQMLTFETKQITKPVQQVQLSAELGGVHTIDK